MEAVYRGADDHSSGRDQKFRKLVRENGLPGRTNAVDRHANRMVPHGRTDGASKL